MRYFHQGSTRDGERTAFATTSGGPARPRAIRAPRRGAGGAGGGFQRARCRGAIGARRRSARIAARGGRCRGGACRADCGQAAPPDHRDRIGQGRGGEIDAGRQSRGGAGATRAQGRAGRCRHLRPLAAAAARHRRTQTQSEGQAADPARNRKRREAPVDGQSGRGGPRDRVARADGGRGAGAIGRGRLGRYRYADRRPAAGDRRCPADDGPEAQARRCDHRFDAAGSGTDGCYARAAIVPRRRCPDRRAGGEHGRLSVPALRRSVRSVR